MTTTIQNNININKAYEVVDSWEDLVTEYDSEHEFEHETKEEFPILSKETMSKETMSKANCYNQQVYTPATKQTSPKKIFKETCFTIEPVHQFPNSYTEDGKSGMTQEQRVQKTRMCRSVETGENCPHGESCRFAHDSHELRTAPCQFGENCRFVRWQTNCYYNTSTKICKFLHPEETKQGYCVRVKIPYIDTSKVVSSKVLGSAYSKPNNCLPAKKIDVPKIVTKMVEFPKIVHKMVPTVEEFPTMVPKMVPTVEEFPTMVPKVDETELETIIKVPREFVMQAIELAMKSGRKNIRVEIC